MRLFYWGLRCRVIKNLILLLRHIVISSFIITKVSLRPYLRATSLFLNYFPITTRTRTTVISWYALASQVKRTAFRNVQNISYVPREDCSNIRERSPLLAKPMRGKKATLGETPSIISSILTLNVESTVRIIRIRAIGYYGHLDAR